MECNFENCPNFERLGKEFADRISELEQENEKLKQTLQEIKEIAEEQINTRMLLADKKSFHKFYGIYVLATKAEEE